MAQKLERLYSRDEITKVFAEEGVSKDTIKKAFTVIMNEDIKKLQRRLKTFKS